MFTTILIGQPWMESCACVVAIVITLLYCIKGRIHLLAGKAHCKLRLYTGCSLKDWAPIHKKSYDKS